MDKFEAIKVFMQIVKSGGFAKAAEELGISSTSASRQLQQLEDQLSVRLLHRSTRSLSLTEAGGTLFRHYERMMGELDSLEGTIASASREARGRLRIALPNTFATRFLQPMLRDYQIANPSVTLDVVLSDERVDLVRDRIDVALRIARELEVGVIARRLACIRVVICAAPVYLERHGEPKTPSDLMRHACLLYTGNYPADEWRFDGPDGRVVQRVQGSNRANNGEILREGALSGDGIIIQPTFLVGADLRAGHLVRILTDYEPASLAAYAVYLNRDHLPRTVRTFIDFLASRFSDPPWWD